MNDIFSSTKAGHLTQIVSTAVLGQLVSSGLTPPDPTTIENYGHLIIQALVAVVTIWATVRKAFQRPQVVGPDASEAAKAGTGKDGTAKGTGAMKDGDGRAQ